MESLATGQPGTAGCNRPKRLTQSAQSATEANASARKGTAEGAPFGREALDGLLALAEQGIREIRALQLRACAQP